MPFTSILSLLNTQAADSIASVSRVTAVDACSSISVIHAVLKKESQGLLHTFNMTETCYSKEEEETIDRVLNFTTERGIDNATIIQRFDKISEEYDEVQITIRWTGPQWMGESVACQYPSNRGNIRILDVAAGTGLVSVELRKHGFVHIDGLEPAERMLEQAKKKNLYERYICDMLGDNTLDIADDTYTAVTMSGLSREIMKKLPVKALEELARVTKPVTSVAVADYMRPVKIRGKIGLQQPLLAVRATEIGLEENNPVIPRRGHVMMNSYDYNFESEILRANLANLESRGIWKLESKQARQHISNGVGGLLHIYTVL